MGRRTPWLLTAVLVLVFQACQTRHNVKVEPVEVKPIHITIDVNVKVDRALDDFFRDIDEADRTIDVTPEAEATGKEEEAE